MAQSAVCVMPSNKPFNRPYTNMYRCLFLNSIQSMTREFMLQYLKLALMYAEKYENAKKDSKLTKMPVCDSCPTQCADPPRQYCVSAMYKLFKLVQSLTSLAYRHWVLFENSAKCLWRMHSLHTDFKEQLKHSLADACRYNRYAVALESAKRTLAQFNDCIDVLVSH